MVRPVLGIFRKGFDNWILLVELNFLNFGGNFSQKILFFAYLSISFLISDCNLEMFYYAAPAKVTRDETRRATNDVNNRHTSILGTTF